MGGLPDGLNCPGHALLGHGPGGRLHALLGLLLKASGFVGQVGDAGRLLRPAGRCGGPFRQGLVAQPGPGLTPGLNQLWGVPVPGLRSGPGAVLHAPHRGHGVEVWVVPVEVVGVPVHHHPKVHKLLDPAAGQGDLLVPGKLLRDGDVELPSHLGVLALLAKLDAGPELCAVGHPLGGALGEADLGMVDATLVGEVEDAIQARVMQGTPSAISSRRHGAATVAAGDDLG